jgi:glycosyltransferase involved in cell wall biosynthesis
MSYKVSIIIPLFNKESYIKNTLNSILNQTEKKFEIIIVDDGSTDKSLEIVEKFTDNRIKLFKQNHGGVSVARNFGVSQAQCDFIAFLDADDEWDDTYLETMLDLKQEYPIAGIYLTSFRYREDNKIKTNKKRISYSVEKPILITNYFNLILKGVIKMSPSCIALNKKIFLEEKGFKIDASWGEDQDLWGRISLKHPIAYNPKTLVTGDRSGNWMKRQNERIKKTPQHPFIASGKNALQGKIPNDVRNDLKELIALYQLKSANLNIQVGKFQTAKEILLEIDTLKFKKQKIYLLLWTNFSKILFSNWVNLIYIMFNNSISLILDRLSNYIDLGVYL